MSKRQASGRDGCSSLAAASERRGAPVDTPSVELRGGPLKAMSIDVEKPRFKSRVLRPSGSGDHRSRPPALRSPAARLQGWLDYWSMSSSAVHTARRAGSSIF
jgi:hypothetical protein